MIENNGDKKSKKICQFISHRKK